MRRRAAQGLMVVVWMLFPLAACNSKNEDSRSTVPAAREHSPSSGSARASRSAVDFGSAARQPALPGKRQSALGERSVEPLSRGRAEAGSHGEAEVLSETDGLDRDGHWPGEGVGRQSAPSQSRTESEEPEDRPERQGGLLPRDLEALADFGAAPASQQPSAAAELLEEHPDDLPRAPVGEAEPGEAETNQAVDLFGDNVDYLAQLESFDPVLRAEAAEMVEPEGVGLRALLVVAAEDPDPRVRTAAVSQLGEADSRAALRGLVQALSDGDRLVVLEAIDAIEFVAGPRMIPRLVPLLDHPDAEVREAAAEAIDFLE